MASDSPLRVLVVEDEPLFAAQLQALLVDLTYQVVGPAANATAALQLFRSASPTPDVALLDINLGYPGTDGIELAQMLLAEQPLPLIFLTAQEDGESFERARALGPAAYLVKPVDPAALQRAIELAVAGFVLARQQVTTPPDEELPENAFFGTPHSGALLPQALFVKENGLLVKVNLADISWVMAEGKFCRIALNVGHTVLVRQLLREISPYLPVDQFVQIQRSYFVNVSCIERLDPVRNIIQVAGNLLPMGRAYRENLLARLRLV